MKAKEKKGIARLLELAGEKKPGLKEYFDALETINTSSIQYVRGMPSIKIFGQTVHSFRKFHEDMLHYRNFSVNYTDNFQNGYVSFKVIMLSLATFFLPVGLYFISTDPANVAFAATLLFFLVLTPGISTPIFKLNSFASTLNVIVEGVKRIDEMLQEAAIAEPAISKTPASSDIAFNHVSFSYGGEGSPDVLHDIGTHGELLAHRGLYRNMWDAYTSTADWRLEVWQEKEEFA